MSGLLIRGAETLQGSLADVRVRGGRIVEIDEGLAAATAERVIEARGRTLLPGIHDHHIHLLALAAALDSVPCGPPRVHDEAGLRAALRTAAAGSDGWVRGIGYFESVSGVLERGILDRIDRERPLRVQHRSGALWHLNSAAIEQLGLEFEKHPGIERGSDGRATGRIWRADAWLRELMPARGFPSLRPVGNRLARLGVTGVTDASPDLDVEARAHLEAEHRRGHLPQRMHLLGVAPAEDTADRTSSTIGPYKIVLPDSGLPDIDALCRRIEAAHKDNRAVALHTVTRESLLLTLVAFAAVGTLCGDRLEHAALVPPESIEQIRALGLAVVTQPGFITDRGEDLGAGLPDDERGDLYRIGSLLRAGVPTAISSDAPYGPVSPWENIAAATTRRSPSGHVLSPDECISPRRALDLALGHPGRPGSRPEPLAVGQPADLILLTLPLAAALAGLPANPVLLTIIGGRILETPA